MGPKRAVVSLLVVAAVVGLAIWLSGPGLGPSDGKKLAPLFAAPAFAYPDQHGQTVTLETMKGKVWVANFIYTTCRTMCPLLTAKMVQLQRRLDGADVRFVSFSVDPEHDTPAVMAEYAKRWRAEETRWLLLSTGPQTLPLTAQGFKIAAEKNDGGDAGDAIFHTSRFLLVDAEGLVRGVYDSEDREQFKALADDVLTLSKQKPAALAHGKVDAEALYHELSCAGCHERSELAPPLRGLNGKRRDIGNAQLVNADAAYVRESILVPDAKRVAGYSVRMPTYAGLLDDAQLDALVKWVLARPDDGSAAAADATLETDPVCGMAVRAAPDSIQATHEGHTYYFCSPGCRERFVAHPGAFIK